MRACFLIGAGASIPLLNVGTSDLTARVLAAEDVARWPDGRYRRRAGTGTTVHGHRHVEAIRELLAVVKSELESFFAEECVRPGACAGQASTYEDLFFACQQVEEMLSGKTENALLRPFARLLEAKAASVDLEPFGGVDRRDGLTRAMREAHLCIRDLVAAALGVRANGADLARAHGLLLGALSDTGLQQANVLTLNHDVLLEQLLSEAQVQYVDGFEATDHEGVRRWSRHEFDAPCRVRLFKVHGSVDWYRFRSGPDPWWDDWIGQVRSGINADAIDRETRGAVDYLDGPLFLIGSFNKLVDYTRPMFIDLFYAAWQALRESDLLVVGGYSFGDKGINSRITDWVYDAPKGRRRIVVINPMSERELQERARGAIRDKWEGWKTDGVLQVIGASLADVSWSQLLDRLRR